MKKIVKNIFFILIGLLLLWYAFRGIEFNEILENLKQVKYIYIFISFLLGYLAYLARAIRWQILIKSIGYNSKIINSINSVSISYFSNLIFPRAGEVVRCSTMSKLENIPMNKLFGTVILERIIDFIILLLLILGTLILQEDILKKFFTEVNIIRNKNQAIEVSNNVYIWAGLIIISIILTIILLRKKILKTNIYKKIIEFLIGVKQGLLSIKFIEKKFYFVLYTLIIWLCYFFMNYIVFLSFKETQYFGLSEGLVLLVVGGLAMVVPVQGGIGSYHLAVKIMLSFYGISEITALSFATLVHSTQTLVALVFGGCAFSYIFYFRNKKV